MRDAERYAYTASTAATAEVCNAPKVLALESCLARGMLRYAYTAELWFLGCDIVTCTSWSTRKMCMCACVCAAGPQYPSGGCGAVNYGPFLVDSLAHSVNSLVHIHSATRIPQGWYIDYTTDGL